MINNPEHTPHNPFEILADTPSPEVSQFVIHGLLAELRRNPHGVVFDSAKLQELQEQAASYVELDKSATQRRAVNEYEDWFRNNGRQALAEDDRPHDNISIGEEPTTPLRLVQPDATPDTEQSRVA